MVWVIAAIILILATDWIIQVSIRGDEPCDKECCWDRGHYPGRVYYGGIDVARPERDTTCYARINEDGSWTEITAEQYQQALKEQGASEAYQRKMLADLCGIMGRSPA